MEVAHTFRKLGCDGLVARFLISAIVKLLTRGRYRDYLGLVVRGLEVLYKEFNHGLSQLRVAEQQGSGITHSTN